MLYSPPSILCLSGFDPSGGAGIQADIESIASMGGHAVPVITALTVQNTQNVVRYQPVEATLFTDQVNTLLDDVAIKAIKIGMIGSRNIAESITTILKQHPDLPVIYDPVLAAGGGTNLTESGVTEMINVIQELILPYTSILTPNSIEARQLSNETDLKLCGKKLMQLGCDSVLLTGSHEDNEHVNNLWFSEGQYVETFSWDRLPGEYHGSGCTLASAIAALIAQGLDPFTAVNEAQDYSWNTLKHAFKISEKGQLIPNRFYWQHAD
ncbi:MAG: hydroxymethylpyrimidine/phosphomethylpyrimidine kinase [Gammaproteobacteria bacterium]|nr:hydroxymethylpyrimidine/phosphomethylpyrimidine kinase [Gammaproteobacteria bacterium]MCW8988144.1 hydroxymethylpyrimidine/phosphomethylpyrimidine kinase [Gammaproteobacteria bacterium]MCW9031913.1 hydroxymethylpyrimidine/phosphomethylpyrimidine kinase [Gammaproteobacteria bacterium]